MLYAGYHYNLNRNLAVGANLGTNGTLLDARWYFFNHDVFAPYVEFGVGTFTSWSFDNFFERKVIGTQVGLEARGDLGWTAQASIGPAGIYSPRVNYFSPFPFLGVTFGKAF